MPFLTTQSGSFFTGGLPVSVPTAPTNIVATATGTTTATVSFNAPQWNGGKEITSYTIVSTPGNFTQTLNQAGSGSFNFTGLSLITSYTFAIYATNAEGNSITGVSNSMMTLPPVGQVEWTTATSTTWTVPAGVTSISIVAVGGGQAGYNNAGSGGRGGGLSYRNNFQVTPGQVLSIVVGAGGGSSGALGANSTVVAAGVNICLAKGGGQSATAIGTASFLGGNGGGGYSDASQNFPGGGGGAAGYAGVGGTGGSYYLNINYLSRAPTAGAGGGGGGGTAYQNPGGYGGGGVGIYGQGANGSANCGGGSGGTNGSSSSTNNGGAGGLYGGGGGGGAGSKSSWTGSHAGGAGGRGAIRIIWPGTQRLFPTTRTANETPT